VKLIPYGIIVSIQGWSQSTTEEMIIEVANAGAVAIRTDKKVKSRLPLIGLMKYKVPNRKDFAYITPSLEDVKEVERWTKYIAVDYREINEGLFEISDYAKEKGLIIIADIGTIEDFENICENDLYYSYIATTLSVLYQKGYTPNFKLIEELQELECSNIIAEGNFSIRDYVKKAYHLGIRNICIGDAITNIYRLTKKFTSVNINNPGKIKEKRRFNN
jgi:putative N-acetylmannosamine-6-phosphate epimerase